MFPRKFYSAVNTRKKQRKHHGNIQKNVEINEKVFILNKKADNPQDYKETSKQTQNPNYSPKKFFIVFVQIKKIKGKNGIKIKKATCTKKLVICIKTAAFLPPKTTANNSCEPS